jgi:transposase-like protein
MQKNKQAKLSEDGRCPYCKSDNVEKAGVEAGTVAQDSSTFIPGLVGYNCNECGGYFHQKPN